MAFYYFTQISFTRCLQIVGNAQKNYLIRKRDFNEYYRI